MCQNRHSSVYGTFLTITQVEMTMCYPTHIYFSEMKLLIKLPLMPHGVQKIHTRLYQAWRVHKKVSGFPLWGPYLPPGTTRPSPPSSMYTLGGVYSTPWHMLPLDHGALDVEGTHNFLGK